MKEFRFNYRGGEIIATIYANNDEEILKKCMNGESSFIIENLCLRDNSWKADDNNPSNYNDEEVCNGI